MATNILACVQIATAIGLLVFWQWWLRATASGSHDTSWWPDGYEAHERSFVLGDHVLAGVLVGAGAGHFMGAPWADPLSLLAAGMMLFIAIMDASYFTQHKMWRLERDGIGNVLIVGWLTILGLTTAYLTGWA